MHISCGKLTSYQFDIILSLGECVEWFCPSCCKSKASLNFETSDALQHKVDLLNKKLDKVVPLISHPTKIIESLSERVTSLERCRSGINQTTNNNDSLTPKVAPPNASQNGDSYASILKKVRTVGVKNVCKDTSDDVSANNSSESSSFCVFANNISREDFKSPVNF